MAEFFNLPVMIHLGQPDTPLPKILALLKRGDIITHMYAPAPNGILDDNGRLRPEVLAARRRGVWFDVGNGTTGHITWEQAEGAIKQGFSRTPSPPTGLRKAAPAGSSIFRT
jgi:dihydroorotase